VRFRVYYPNGARYVDALTVGEAYAVAMERWGTPPAYVEAVSA
jgi:hypothetical protein